MNIILPIRIVSVRDPNEVRGKDCPQWDGVIKMLDMAISPQNLLFLQ